MALDRKVGKESNDFFFAHVVGVAFLVKENETANPIDVSLFGADAVMLDAQMPADAVEQFGRSGGRSGSGRGDRVSYCAEFDNLLAVSPLWAVIIGLMHGEGEICPYLNCGRFQRTRSAS